MMLSVGKVQNLCSLSYEVKEKPRWFLKSTEVTQPNYSSSSTGKCNMLEIPIVTWYLAPSHMLANNKIVKTLLPGKRAHLKEDSFQPSDNTASIFSPDMFFFPWSHHTSHTASTASSPAQGSLPHCLRMSCRREISNCSPAPEGKQHCGEEGTTSSPPWSPTLTLVVCAPFAICPTAQGCQNLRQLWLFHATYQSCQETFCLPNLPFPGIMGILLIIPDVCGHLKSLALPSSTLWDRFALIPWKDCFKWIFHSTAFHPPAWGHHRSCLNLSQLEVWNVTETFAEGVGDKVMQHPLPSGAVPHDSNFPSLKVLFTVLLFGWRAMGNFTEQE